MLSRVANCLYWMSRYLERVENIARILDTNLQLLLDYRDLGDERLSEHWTPVVQSMGNEALFFNFYPVANGHSVTEFFTFRADNPGSVASCIAAARENARTVRDQISMEVWEEVNRLHLFLRSPRAKALWKSSPHDFFQELKTSSLYLQGLMGATIPQDEGWNFIEAGKLIERADMTTRILDVRYESVSPTGEAGGADPSFIVMEWVAILRSCSAWDSYRQVHSGDVQPQWVVEFLLLSPDFPRSVHFCLEGLDASLRRISGVAGRRFSNQAEKLSGRLLAEIQFSAVEDVLKAGLHQYLDALQLRFIEIDRALMDQYFFRSFASGEDDLVQQQQQQQQAHA